MNDIAASTLEEPPEKDVSAPRIGTWESFSLSVVHVFAAGLLKLLTLRGYYRFGRVFGTVEWLINFKRRARFAKAMAHVLGRPPAAAERRRETREYFMRSRCDKLLYLVFDVLPKETAEVLLTIANQDLLDRAVARGRGVYVALSHHGAQHVIAMLMSLRGYRVAGVRDRNEGAMRKFVQDRFDKRRGDAERMRVLFADGYPRDIYRCLKDGFLLGSAMDVSRLRSDRQKSEPVTMFGELRHFPTGPLRVALRCGSPVLQAFIHPEPNFRYRLEIVGMLLDPDEEVDEAGAVSRAMKDYASHVEDRMRRYPSLLSRL